MTKEESRTLHALYAAVHRAHKDLPAVWTHHECNRILTAIMAAKPFSWRVVGITQKALRQFSELDFRYKGQLGFTRAHLVPRIETVRKILKTEEPFPEDEFLDIWLKNDRTVICSRGENKAALLGYIRFKNNDGALFSCAGKLAGWGHGKREREFLRD